MLDLLYGPCIYNSGAGLPLQSAVNDFELRSSKSTQMFILKLRRNAQHHSNFSPSLTTYLDAKPNQARRCFTHLSFDTDSNGIETSSSMNIEDFLEAGGVPLSILAAEPLATFTL